MPKPKPIKARFYVESVKSLHAPNGDKSAEVVSLKPVYSSDPASENYSFSQATPSGSMELLVSNPDAWGMSGTYTLDITPVNP